MMDAMATNRTSPGAGPRAGRAALLVALLLALAMGAAWWLLGTAEPAEQRTTRTGDVVRQAQAAEAAPTLEGPGDLMEPGAGRAGAGELAPGAARVRLSGPGLLRGVVLDREGGYPVPGVEVSLLPVPPVAADIAPEISRFLGVGDEFSERIRPIATAVSDASGSFAFEGVREGRWYLGARSPHHVLDAAESVRVLASGSGGPATVWVRTGGRVRGRVVYAGGSARAGEPVPGATLALGTGAMGFLEAAADGRVALLRTTADGEGRFVFPAVPVAEGYELAAIGRASTIEHVTGLDVAAGEDVELVVEVRPGTTLSGRVLSEPADGGEAQPLAGAQIGALPRGLRHLKLARELIVATHAVTDEDGRYTLEGLPFGEADLLGMAGGHVPGRGPVVQLAGAGEMEAPDFVLRRGPMVRGRVVDGLGEPVAGARVLWNAIDIEQVDGRPTMASLFVGAMRDFAFPRTGPDGTFVAGPFPREAPYQLRVLKSGFEAKSLEWTPSPGAESVDGLREPEALEELLVVLGAGGGLSGVVTDASTGEPVPSFTVSVTGRIESNPNAPSQFNPFAAGLEVEDPEGRFRIEAASAGPQTLRVSAEGYLETELEVALAEGELLGGLEILLRPGARIVGRVVDGDGEAVPGAQVTTAALVRDSFAMMERQRMEIEKGLAVRGRPAQRMPPVGFLRYAVALGLLGGQQTLAGPDGAFELEGLEPGPHEVLAFHPDFRAGSADAVAEVGAEPTPVVVRLTEGGGVEGKVSDRFGRPIEDATVIAASPGITVGASGSGALHQARTSDDGSYALRNMEAGAYILVSTRGDDTLSITSLVGSLNFDFVTVPEDRVVTKDIVDRAAGACRLSGFVTRRGEPVTTGVLVAVAFEAEGLLGLDLKVAPIENDGAYAFDGLAPGEYQLRYDDRRTRSTVIVDVPDAPELVQDVALPDAVLEGRVVDRSSGEPVRGASVRVEALTQDGPEGALAALVSARGGRQRTESARDGTFRLRGLGEGRYRVRISGGRSGPRGDSVRYAPLAPFVVELGADEERDLGDVAVDPGLELRGVVVDEAGQAVGGADVLARLMGAGPTPPRRSKSSEDGAFRLRGLGPGAWELVAEADGYAAGRPVALEIGAGAAEVPDQRLELPRGTAVVAVVFDGDGAPASGATCVLTRKGVDAASEAPTTGGFLRRLFTGDATTDAEGKLALGQYSAGLYELRVSRGLTSVRQEVEVMGDEEQRVEVRLR